MTNSSPQGFEYKPDDINSSLGVLAIRLVVGLMIGLVAGYVGNMINGLVVPSPGAGDDIAFLVRMTVIGSVAAGGGMVAWFNAFDSKSGAASIWVVSAVGGLIGAVVGYFIGSSYIDHPDVYILNQRLTQVVILGSALGANAFAAIFTLLPVRFVK